MQERNELRQLPLLLVVSSRLSGCLKDRHFGKYTRHLHHLLPNFEICAQGYPQKMWNKNSRAIPNSEGRVFDNCLEFLCSFTVVHVPVVLA